MIALVVRETCCQGSPAGVHDQTCDLSARAGGRSELTVQVVGGITSAAATGAKLLGKGAWQLGKFAANGGKS